MIRHTVAFKLKHDSGTQPEADFLAAARKLASIPGVHHFEQMRQVSDKNPYTFNFSMEFDSQADYDGYNSHPAHVAFVRDRWIPEVAAFLEADYISLLG